MSFAALYISSRYENVSKMNFELNSGKKVPGLASRAAIIITKGSVIDFMFKGY